MSGPSRIVILGASLAGGSCALALREQGFEGEILLIGDEPHRPYERPPLSKALLLGQTDEPDWVGGSDVDFAAQQITLLTGRTATRLLPDRRLVVAGGEEHPYDRLLLATGSSPRRLDLPGGDLDGVCYLRTLDDALALRERLTDQARVVIVGAGWIGCEVAAAARQRGAAVTMLDPLSQPLVRVLGDQVGASFAALHREHQVDLRLGAGVAEFTGDQTVDGVALTGGGHLRATTVVVGVGVLPNVALADAAGLALADGGVAVDATLRTSDPHIYAAGDIAAHDHPHYTGRIRVEHWANAKDQGSHVAQNLLGAHTPYQARPFFFSDQYDLGCEYRGLADPRRDQLVVRGDLAAREYIAFWLRDGAVAAALNVNDWDHGEALQDLVETERRVTPDELISGQALRTG